MIGASFERELWARYETIHAVTYFAEACKQAATDAGARGYWMGYFGFRAAPMGPVAPGVVEATFFNFAPSIVVHAVPDVWTYCDPAALLQARASSAAAVLRTASTTVDAVAAQLDETLSSLLATQHGGGMALFAANRDLPLPDDPVERLWQHTTSLREHRGDGHIAALVAEGIDGCEAHILISADGGTPQERIRNSRGWTEHEWGAAVDRLQSRGLLDGTASLTVTGQAVRDRVETITDRLAGRATASLSDEARAGLLAALDPIARDVVAAQIISFPNPIGLAPR